MNDILKAPMPFFGGKSRVTPLVWARFGDVANYVEAFAGSLAVLLGRPHEPRIETVNDKDAYIANFWRALQAAPEVVAKYADNPVNEADLHARHIWLVQNAPERLERLFGDPDFYDAKVAGWWVWGISCWIGGGWCSGAGPWVSVDGRLVNRKENDGGVWKQIPELRHGGKGVLRKMPHLGHGGKGVNRKRQNLANSGEGVLRYAVRDDLAAYMQALAARLRHVRICCGDWTRVMGPSVTFLHGLTGVFLDPPYSAEAGRDNELYRVEDNSVAHDCRRWCIENGANPLLRIALCGYAGEGHEELLSHGWTLEEWRANGGYGNQGDGAGRKNAKREIILFSPHCLSGRAEICDDLFANILDLDQYLLYGMTLWLFDFLYF